MSGSFNIINELHKKCLFCMGIFIFANFGFCETAMKKRAEVLQEAENLLENANISYVYGGSQLGEQKICEACNECLRDKAPKATSRLSSCPSCQKCSLDCSHFVNLAFRMAGLTAPYLATPLMLSLSSRDLERSYSLRPIAPLHEPLKPGDLLVYEGHVVMLEKLTGDMRGDIVHATSGREVRGPGQGIQRVRNVLLSEFRGPLQRVLRHVSLDERKKMRRLRKIANDQSERKAR